MGLPDPEKYYVIINQQSGTAFDLSGDDQRSIIGFHVHRRQNQQWKFEQVEDNRWTIQNRHNRKFLNVDIPNTFRGGVRVIANNEELRWELRWDDQFKGWRFIIPGTPQNADLSDRGNADEKTPVTLWEISPQGKNQVWRLEEAN